MFHLTVTYDQTDLWVLHFSRKKKLWVLHFSRQKICGCYIFQQSETQQRSSFVHLLLTQCETRSNAYFNVCGCYIFPICGCYIFSSVGATFFVCDPLCGCYIFELSHNSRKRKFVMSNSILRAYVGYSFKYPTMSYARRRRFRFLQLLYARRVKFPIFNPILRVSISPTIRAQIPAPWR